MIVHRALILGFCGLAAAALTPSAQAHYDIWIGRGAEGQLRLAGVPTGPWRLAATAPGGLLAGWAGDDPGFSALPVQQPANDLYWLAWGASLHLEIVRVQPGLRIWQAGLGVVASSAGETIFLGPFNLHSHPTWHLDAGLLGSEWRGFRVVWLRVFDTGSTAYADSEPFRLVMTNYGFIPGDANGDGEVDEADWAIFAGAWLGPDVPTPLAPGPRRRLDLDEDLDLDLADFAAFQQLFWPGS